MTLPKCEACLDLDEDLLHRNPDEEEYCCHLSKFIDSSKKCENCRLLLRALRHCFPEVFDKAPFLLLYFHQFGGFGHQQPNPVFGMSVGPIPIRERETNPLLDMEEDPFERMPGGGKRRTLHIFSVKDKPNPWPFFGEGSVFSPDPQALAAQVKEWIEDCEKNHTDCQRTETTLPKRVVQIVPGSKPGACKVRLYEPSPDTQGAYACLSHCWGKHEIIVTTKANFSQHQDEIPWNDLSNTFQDAIEFCLRLGPEFIWIDSLCIIQDFAEDWEQEAVKMAAYYTNAHVTLAATAAADGTIGLFPESHAANQPLELVGKNAHGDQYYLVVRAYINHPLEDELGLKDKQELLNDFPLMARGWVHQEHILSRRFLHFGSRELMWECHSATLCQCGVIPQEPGHRDTTNQVLSVVKASLDMTDEKARRSMWYGNVQTIMNLNFTYDKDRLPAAAGVASCLAKGTKGRYLAGLWEDSLVADLCWSMTENGKRPNELKGIPSWSWGSVSKGPAIFWCWTDMEEYSIKTTATILHVDCKPERPSLLGHLDRAILVIEGQVITVDLPLGFLSHDQVRKNASKSTTVPGDLDRYWSFYPDDQNWGKDDAASDVLLLEMAREAAYGQESSGYYLALQPAVEKGVFRRVGLLVARVVIGAEDEDNTFLDYFSREATTSTVRIC